MQEVDDWACSWVDNGLWHQTADILGVIEYPVENNNLCGIVVAHSWEVQKQTDREELQVEESNMD